jgi:hypothetical protein
LDIQRQDLFCLRNEKGFFSFAGEKAGGEGEAGAAKLMKPRIELNLNGRSGL